MEAAEKRRTEEKERRIQEQIAIQKEKKKVAEKIAARAFAQSYLQNLVPVTLDSLATNGYFYEEVERELETEFLPWLTVKLQNSVQKYNTARAIADGNIVFILDLIRAAIEKYQTI
jgi:radial spoke head protein 3